MKYLLNKGILRIIVLILLMFSVTYNSFSQSIKDTEKLLEGKWIKTKIQFANIDSAAVQMVENQRKTVKIQIKSFEELLSKVDSVTNKPTYDSYKKMIATFETNLKNISTDKAKESIALIIKMMEKDANTELIHIFKKDGTFEKQPNNEIGTYTVDENKNINITIGDKKKTLKIENISANQLIFTCIEDFPMNYNFRFIFNKD